MDYSYKNCEYIFCQSRSIKNLIKKKINNQKKAIYFPSWSEDLPFNKRKNIHKLIDKKYFNIMFTGNIGEAQDFNSIIKAAKILKNQNIKWVIVGTGRFIKKFKLLILREKIESSFIFLGPQEKKYINHIISFSDCLLISLKKNSIFSKTVPGKLSNYMISKKPIIGMISGDTKKLINQSKCGLCCNSGNYLKLSQNILRLKKQSKKQKTKLGKNGYKYAKKFFNKENLFKKFEKLLFN
jgi:glycosyltransferase involved in cell wall biosynthesis